MDDIETEKQETLKAYNRSTSYNKSINDKRPLSSLEIRKNASNPPKPAGPFTKKFSRKELCNIDDNAFDRIRHAIDNFSKAHQNVRSL